VNEYLVEMCAAGLKVNWGTLLVGLQGPGAYPRLLTLGDIDAFAAARMKSAPSSCQDAVDVVVSLGQGLEATLAELMRRAQTEDVDPSIELRKWRAVLLKREMSRLPARAPYALNALTEFWERFGYPGDSPHVVQGRGNAVTPNEYYTDHNLERTLQAHREWLERETSALRQEK